MTSNSATPVANGAARAPGHQQTRHGTPKLRTDGVSSEARRQAAAILEVLAGTIGYFFTKSHIPGDILLFRSFGSKKKNVPFVFL
jgi:hypothetical protein